MQYRCTINCITYADFITAIELLLTRKLKNPNSQPMKDKRIRKLSIQSTIREIKDYRLYKTRSILNNLNVDIYKSTFIKL